MGRFGDWGKGAQQHYEVWIIDYKVRHANGVTSEGHMRIITTEGAGKEAAVTRLKARVKKTCPQASVEIVKVHLPGRTPSGLFVPPGYEDYT